MDRFKNNFIEAWGTSSNDALRTPLLSRDFNGGSDIEKWNMKVDDRIDSAHITVNENAPLTSNCAEANRVDTCGVGLFISDKKHLNVLMRTLSQIHPALSFLNMSNVNNTELELHENNVSALIISLHEESNQPEALHYILGRYADVDTLFLFDSPSSRQTLQKIESFLKENILQS
jgi:hypothetical protein